MADACNPKLYYFDGPGKVELAREILVYAEIKFDDIRFTNEEWGAKYKSQAPLGTAPFYEEGDVKIGGSIGISRYLADKYGLGGSNAIESAQLESFIDVIFDMASKLYGILMGPEDKREDCKKEFLETIPAKLAFLEKQVKGEKTFLPSGKLSYADIHLSIFHFILTSVKLDVFQNCPKLIAVATPISDLERIKEYRKSTFKRPQ
eukprot:TRINITY_DN3133_c0_g1_i1.p1 TRINITY_DN3133_c0_g1~~TRINITY_DN3133_c0_g1_i1.p1  ORF type:complete len:205 (+),score=23.15 TRINITY_DN3133_c0_g1_i1:100-714(+)